MSENIPHGVPLARSGQRGRPTDVGQLVVRTWTRFSSFPFLPSEFNCYLLDLPSMSMINLDDVAVKMLQATIAGVEIQLEGLKKVLQGVMAESDMSPSLAGPAGPNVDLPLPDSSQQPLSQPSSLSKKLEYGRVSNSRLSSMRSQTTPPNKKARNSQAAVINVDEDESSNLINPTPSRNPSNAKYGRVLDSDKGLIVFWLMHTKPLQYGPSALTTWKKLQDVLAAKHIKGLSAEGYKSRYRCHVMDAVKKNDKPLLQQWKLAFEGKTPKLADFLKKWVAKELEGGDLKKPAVECDSHKKFKVSKKDGAPQPIYSQKDLVSSEDDGGVSDIHDISSDEDEIPNLD